MFWLLRKTSVLVLFVGIFGGVLAQDVKPLKDFSGLAPYKILGVVDGGTVYVEINGEKKTVRLIGVDTPETAHPSKPVETYGKEASEFTKNLLLGESVYLEFDETTIDKYGRVLAYLYRAPDGLFCNLEIITTGYGHAYTVYPFKYKEIFQKAEIHARDEKKGLWGLAATSLVAPPVKPSQDNDVTVYVTKTGTKYHAAGCRYLARSSIPMRISQAKVRYGPCSVCRPPT